MRIRILIVLSAIGVNFFPGCAPTADESGLKRPNILFIAVDDMNDWVGFLEDNMDMDVKTPHLDSLAASSLVFTNAHTPAPACAPSRAAIMTGVHHIRSGVENVYWGDGPKWRQFEALKNVETIDQFFHNRGYKTLGAGKIYHAMAPPRTTSSQVEPENWDFYYPSAYISHPYQIRAPEEVIYPDSLDNEGRRREFGYPWTWAPLQVPDEKMADYHVMDWASYELQQDHDMPFFIATGTWKPHDSWEVPQKYFDMYPLEDIKLPDYKKNDLNDAFDHGRRGVHKWVLENKQWDNIIQGYAASVSFADAMVGKLLNTLENSPHADNTIVVLWSDHGMHMGEKENFQKFTLWESSTRVPMIIKMPGETEPGSEYTKPVSLMDIYPTLVDAAGFDIPSHVDGTSLVPMFKDQSVDHDPVVTSYRFGFGRREKTVNGHAVRSENYRYIYYPEIGLEELYDHRIDSMEWENIAYKEENMEVIQRHREILKDRLPELTWKEGTPEGYEITEDGAVRKIGFKAMVEQIN